MAKVEHLKDFVGCTAKITGCADGGAQLVIKTPQGVKVHDKKHKSVEAAKRAWYRFIS